MRWSWPAHSWERCDGVSSRATTRESSAVSTTRPCGAPARSRAAWPLPHPRRRACTSATTLGERVSILVGRSKWIPEMHENVVKYGFGDRLASFRPLRMAVNEFQEDPARTEERILQEARLAVEEDGADVIVLGCTIEFGFYRKVQDELGVPVVDAIVAPLRYAELLADIRLRHGWAHEPRARLRAAGRGGTRSFRPGGRASRRPRPRGPDEASDRVLLLGPLQLDDSARELDGESLVRVVEIDRQQRPQAIEPVEHGVAVHGQVR